VLKNNNFKTELEEDDEKPSEGRIKNSMYSFHSYFLRKMYPSATLNWIAKKTSTY